MTSAAPERAIPDQLYAVELDLDRTGRELLALRDRVARLRLGSTTAYAPVPTSAAVPPRPDRVRSTPSHPVTPPTDPEVTPAQPPWWLRDGALARVLSVVGSAVLLLGVTLLLVLAVQHGYFGPVPRVVVGTAVSATLVLLGVRVHRRQAENPGAVALAATGIAGGLLAVAAVTTMYGWVGMPVGLALAVLIGGVGVVLARRWDSQVLAVLVVLALSVLAPVVADGTLWAADAFLVVVATGATLWLRHPSWPVLHVVRVVGPAVVLVASVLLTDPTTDPVAAWAVTALATAFALLTLVGEVVTSRVEPGPARSSALAAVAVAPALLAPLWATDGWVATLWLAVLAGGWLVLSTRTRSSLLGTVLVAAGAVSLLLAVGSLHVEGALVPSVLLVGVVFLAAGVLRSDPVVGRVGAVVGTVGLLGYLPVVAPVLGLGDLTAWDLVASVTALALAALGSRSQRSIVPTQAARRSRLVLLPAALLGVLGTCVTAGTLLGRLAGDPTTGFLGGHAVATSAWLVVAGGWLLSTLRRPDAVRLRTAVLVTGLAVAKLLLFDLATLDGLIRVAAFVVVGAVLLAVGTRYARRVGSPVAGSGTGSK